MAQKDKLHLQWGTKILSISGLGNFTPDLDKPIPHKFHLKIHAVTSAIMLTSLALCPLDAENFDAAARSLNAGFIMVASAVKVASFYAHRDTLHYIIRVIENESRDHNRSDKFTNQSAKESKAIFLRYLLSPSITVITYGIQSYFSVQTETEKEVFELIHVYIPFDYLIAERYGVLRLTITGFLLYHGYALFFLDILTVALFTYIGGQFEALADMFAAIDYTNSYEDIETTQIEFKKAVIYHLTLLKCTDGLQTLMTYVFLIQLIGSCVPLCFIMFLVIQAPTMDQARMLEVVGHFTFLILVAYQLFLMIRCADVIVYKATLIAEGVYSSNWYLAPPNMRRQLTRVIQRANRPVEFSAMGVFPVTVDTGIKIVKSAYAALMLIRGVD